MAKLTYLESGTVARAAEVSAQWFNTCVHAGRIVPDAITDKGTTLYLPESVEKIKKELSKRST